MMFHLCCGVRVDPNPGIAVPRTLVTNDPQAVRELFEQCAGRVVFKPLLGFVTDYAEVSRVPSQSRGRDAERIDFTGSLAGQAVKGTLYFVQDGSTICSLSFLTFADAEAQYAPALAAMIDSLQAVKP